MKETAARIPESELVLNPDGSVYHLNLRPEHIADDVIIVGDQERVKKISDHFGKIEFSISHREFITHTGYYKGKRITVLSTGIGTDNIDIVLNELDAAVNINLKTRTINARKKSLNIIRIGTSGALQAYIPVDSVVISEFGIGIDGLMNFYSFKHTSVEKRMENLFKSHTGWKSRLGSPYVVKGSSMLINKLAKGFFTGLTVTAPGFYGPQGRILRLKPHMNNLNDKLASFRPDHRRRITNFEMETSALYGLGRALGHRCCTVCAIIANRASQVYSKNPGKSMDLLIRTVLDRI